MFRVPARRSVTVVAAEHISPGECARAIAPRCSVETAESRDGGNA
jgi:hypothetical protein